LSKAYITALNQLHLDKLKINNMSFLSTLDLPYTVVILAGATLVLGYALVYAMFSSGGDGDSSNSKIGRITSYLSIGGGSNTEEVEELSPKFHVNILYGTQTGTADSFSGQLSMLAPDHGYESHILDVSDLNSKNMFQKLKTINGDAIEEKRDDPYYVILMVSTYGEGEPPDTVLEFHKLCLRKSGVMKGDDEDMNGGELKDLTYFCNMSFCVFGLGNTEYDNYNSMGKFFDECFEVLGGKRMKELGLGDDGDDIEGDFEKWSEELWGALDSSVEEEDNIGVDGEEMKDYKEHEEEKKEEKKEIIPKC